MAITAENVAGADVSDEEEDRLLAVMDVFDEAEPGDKVIWDDRANPLDVRDPEDIGEEPADNTLYVQGPKKGIYELELRTASNGIPYVHGSHGRSVENLRIVEEADEDGDSQDETPGVGAGKTAPRGGAVGDEYGPLRNLTVSRPAVPGKDRLLVKGSHQDVGRFELVFERDSRGGSFTLVETASGTEGGDLPTVAEPVEEYLIETRNSPILPQYAEDPEPDVGSRIPGDIGWTAAANAEEQDADKWVFEQTQDIFAEYEDLEPFGETSTLSKLRNSLPFGGAGKFTKGHTFVDELLSILEVSVPRAYNNWQLFDYGIVDGAEMRSLGWVNTETREYILLKGERNEEGETPNYAVYYFDADEQEPGTLDPYETATGGTHVERVESMLMVVQNLMGAPDNLDVEVVEYATDSPGQRYIRDSVDWERVGRRVLDAAGELAERIYDGTISRTEAAVSWLKNNYDTIGYGVAVTIVNMVSHAIAQVTDVQVSPVLERGDSNLVERVGVEVGYTYKPDRSVNIPGGKIAEVGPSGNKTNVRLDVSRDFDPDDERQRRQQRQAALNQIKESIRRSGVEELEDLDGVGPATAQRLRGANLRSIGDLVEASQADLEAIEGISQNRAESIKSQVGGAGRIEEVFESIAQGGPFRPTVGTKKLLAFPGTIIGADAAQKSTTIRDFLSNSKTALYAVMVVGALDLLERTGLDEYTITLPGSGRIVRAWTAEKLASWLPDDKQYLLDDFGDEARRGDGRTAGDAAVAGAGDPQELGSAGDDATLPTWKTPKPGNNLPKGDTPRESDGMPTTFSGKKQQYASQIFTAESNAEAAETLRDIITGRIESKLEPNPRRAYTVEDIERIVKREVEQNVLEPVEVYWPDLLTHLNEKLDQDVQPIEHFIGFNSEPEGDTNLLRPNVGSSEYFYDRVATDLIEKGNYTKRDFDDRSTSPNKVGEIDEDDVMTTEDPRQKAAQDLRYFQEFQQNVNSEKEDIRGDGGDERPNWNRAKENESRSRDPTQTFSGRPGPT